MQCSPKELERIYRQPRPGSLLAPIRQENSPTPEGGPRFMVFRMYSELNLEPAPGVGVLASPPRGRCDQRHWRIVLDQCLFVARLVGCGVEWG